MGTFEIKGGLKLSGDIYPQGAKNEALQILCAILLTPEEVVVHNVPSILDVNKLIELIKCMGVEVKKVGDSSYSFKAQNVDIN